MPTENYGWEYLQEGDAEYPVSHQSQVDTIDGEVTRVEGRVTIKDVEANIQNHTPAAGRVFDATDTEREYVGDGTAWVQRATRGPNPTLESATVNGPVDADEVSIGATGPVSGIAGDSGEIECLSSVFSNMSSQTTSTTYEILSHAGNTPPIPISRLTNISGYSEYYISFACDFGTTTGSESTNYVRLRDVPETEMSVTTGGSNYGSHSPLVPIPNTGIDEKPFFIEGKTDNGGVNFDTPAWYIWGEIA